jgi:hypothetical protein
VVHTYNPAFRKLRQEVREFEASLIFIEKPCLKKTWEKGRWREVPFISLSKFPWVL